MNGCRIRSTLVVAEGVGVEPNPAKDVRGYKAPSSTGHAPSKRKSRHVARERSHGGVGLLTAYRESLDSIVFSVEITFCPPMPDARCKR